VIISTENLTKRFGSTLALHGVTCGVEPGATGLLGPNGAGKTTLLRILLGLLPADGSASVLGIDPMRRPLEVRARLGYMPESECLIPGLTGIEMVTFMGELASMPRRVAFKRAHEIMYHVGLGEARYRDATEYSVGMQQRLKLATALVHDPDLLFLDEPTNGLDPKGRDEMLVLIRELAVDHGKHLLLSSHLLKDVEQVCGDVLMLKEGRIVQRGPIDELTGAARGEYEVVVEGEPARFRAAVRDAGGEESGRDEAIHVKLPAGAETDFLFRAARDAGVQVRGLQLLRRTLEDVFLDAVEGKDAG
jgi:ABC-2 type transport system ATP-binding protein